MMHPRTPGLLDDILRACRYIEEDVSEMPLADYHSQRQARQAVERNLEIIGEALARLRAIDLDTVVRISDVPRIIGLRNRLVHGYDLEIDNALVWQTARASVPILKAEVMRLIPPFED